MKYCNQSDLIPILLQCPGSVDDTDGHDGEEHQHAAHQGGHHCLNPPGGGTAKRFYFIGEQNMIFNIKHRENLIHKDTT